MSGNRKSFKSFRIYAVSDLHQGSSGELRKIEAAYRGGADVVQLRSKTLPDAALIRLGLKIRSIATQKHRWFIVNDRVDIALATGADGVHLGQDDMPVRVARQIVRKRKHEFIIGKSTHSLKQAIAAAQEGADYIGVGPVFATPTKPGVRPVGLGFVKQAAKHIRIPWVAIGGIDFSNVCEVATAGATRIAVVRAIFAEKDPEYAVRELKRQLDRFRVDSPGS